MLDERFENPGVLMLLQTLKQSLRGRWPRALTLRPCIQKFKKIQKSQKGLQKALQKRSKNEVEKYTSFVSKKNSIFNIFGGILGAKMESKTISRDDGPKKRESPFHTVKTILI